MKFESIFNFRLERVVVVVAVVVVVQNVVGFSNYFVWITVTVTLLILFPWYFQTENYRFTWTNEANSYFYQN